MIITELLSLTTYKRMLWRSQHDDHGQGELLQLYWFDWTRVAWQGLHMVGKYRCRRKKSEMMLWWNKYKLLGRVCMQILPQWTNWSWGRNIKSVISKHLLRIKFMSTCEIALRWMPQNTFGNKSTLVLVMAWYHEATQPFPEPMLNWIFVVIWFHQATIN